MQHMHLRWNIFFTSAKLVYILLITIDHDHEHELPIAVPHNKIEHMLQQLVTSTWSTPTAQPNTNPFCTPYQHLNEDL